MLANALSLLRIALAPVVLYSFREDGGQAGLGTLAILGLAGATDLLDGIAARRLDQVSRLGRVLDPVADKILILSVCAALVAWRSFPAWLLLMQLVRDAAILGAGAFLLRRRRVMSPSLAGKAATWAMFLTILAYMAAPGEPPGSSWLQGITAGLLLLSAMGYARRLIAFLREADPGAEPAR